MKKVLLDKKIHNFLARKERQFPELHRPVSELTREFDVQERAHSLIHLEEDFDDQMAVKKVAHGQLHYAV